MHCHFIWSANWIQKPFQENSHLIWPIFFTREVLSVCQYTYVYCLQRKVEWFVFRGFSLVLNHLQWLSFKKFENHPLKNNIREMQFVPCGAKETWRGFLSKREGTRFKCGVDVIIVMINISHARFGDQGVAPVQSKAYEVCRLPLESYSRIAEEQARESQKEKFPKVGDVLKRLGYFEH